MMVRLREAAGRVWAGPRLSWFARSAGFLPAMITFSLAGIFALDTAGIMASNLHELQANAAASVAFLMIPVYAVFMGILIWSRGVTASRTCEHPGQSCAVIEACRQFLEKSGFSVKKASETGIEAVRSGDAPAPTVVDLAWQGFSVTVRASVTPTRTGSTLDVECYSFQAVNAMCGGLLDATALAVARLDAAMLGTADQVVPVRKDSWFLGSLTTRVFLAIFAVALTVTLVVTGISSRMAAGAMKLMDDNATLIRILNFKTLLLWGPKRPLADELERVAATASDTETLESALKRLDLRNVPGDLVAFVVSREDDKAEWAFPPPERLASSLPIFVQERSRPHWGPLRIGNDLYVKIDPWRLSNRLKLSDRRQTLFMGIALNEEQLAERLSAAVPGGTELTWYESGRPYLRLRWTDTGRRPDIDGGGDELPREIVRHFAEMRTVDDDVWTLIRNMWTGKSIQGQLIVEEQIATVTWRTAYIGGMREDGTGWHGERLKEMSQWTPRESEYLAHIPAGIMTFLLVPILFLTVVVSILVARGISRPVLEARDALQSIASGDFSVRVPEDRSDEIGQLQAYLNRTAAELHKRDSIRDLMGKYLSKQVADRILEGEDAASLTGTRRELTVMFADVRGFTTYSEKHDPEQVTRSLNEYFEIMVEVIAAHEGVLDKFIGDGLMVVFGSPVHQPDHAARAVATALEMQAALQSLNLRRVQRGDVPINIGIGINTGLAISGNLGSIRRMEFTVIGDTVNTAARLESKAEKGQVLVGRATYDLVQDLIVADELGPLTVKGKTAPVEAWSVKGLKPRT
ncbi:adenylate/guanylate cyclase domain-containing protein [Candidatus Ozemobacteraceae bacterium]|nr:adenylate/guanylate cyclase domain-containing protein [Candidatus Ozemobacteraceae bacterium]